MYLQHRGIIIGRAVSWTNTTGYELDELISVGNSVFMEIVSRELYDRNMGKFSTYLTRALNARFSDYVKRYPIAMVAEDQSEPVSSESSAQLVAPFQDMIESLSDEAKMVVAVILTGPAEVLDIAGYERPRIVRGAIRDWCREIGWSWPMIWSVFHEIRDVVRVV